MERRANDDASKAETLARDEAKRRRVHRGRWTVLVPEDRADLFTVHAKDETLKGGGFSFTFTGTRRELAALRVALEAAIKMPKGVE